MHEASTDILIMANKLVGTKFRHQGRNTSGLDCVGLLIFIVNELGISSFKSINYAKRPSIKDWDQEMVRSGCKPKAMDDVESGDILRMAVSNWPVHCGIYEKDEQDKEWIIHAWYPAKKVVKEHLNETKKSMISSVWSFPER